MKAFCRTCETIVEYREVSQQETLLVEGIEISVVQKHAFCTVCGEEIFPDALMKQNIENAHEAYRIAKGSISVTEIKALLEKYNIGANPLSKLLGWGENTIERQMKHTIPDTEHADQLKKLFNPVNMGNLLLKNGSSISEVALAKAMEACIACLKELISSDIHEEKGKWPVFFEKKQTIYSSIIVTIDVELRQEGYTISGADYPVGNYANSNPFDLLSVA
ncbi:MAG: hypothetical protein IKN04_19895 [Clostridia bacterium]|nr:hypothetical protein [Clostridia bacterium]